MNKTKVDFIADLLSNKAIKPAHKEKLFSLVSKELEKIGESDERIISRLKELEAEIKVIKTKQISDSVGEIEGKFDSEAEEGYTIGEEEEEPREEDDETAKKIKAFWEMVSNKNNLTTGEVISKTSSSVKKTEFVPKSPFTNKISPPNPQNTKNFLTYFRHSEGLKYLTHDFKDPSAPPDRKTLLTLAKNEFEEALNKYPDIPTYIKRRIEEFAFKENPEWFIRRGNKRIKVNEGWNSKNFIEWFDNQKSPFIKHPCRNSKWNKLIIEPFKKSIQVRDEILLEVIEDNIKLINDSSEEKQVKVKFKYDDQSLKVADFYTDVDSLGLALYKIFTSIKVHALKQNNFDVTIEYIPDFEGLYKCIRICHKNSKPTKLFDKDFLGGDMTEVRTSLYGLCNWAIESRFEDGDYRKYFLYDKSISPKNTSIKIEREVNGFTHLLMFY